MHYNFVRIHQTMKITPAMAAGVTDKLWEMSDMVKVLQDWEAVQVTTCSMRPHLLLHHLHRGGCHILALINTT
jgi:hypothetical protein